MVRGVDAGRMKDSDEHYDPANWREGRTIIRGDPIANLDYFSAVDGQHKNGMANGTRRMRVD